MYTDVMSSAGYGSFNRKLARLTNLSTAVYWAEILDISTRVIKKHTYNDEGYFKVDREYITNQTGLDITAQYECDKVLSKIEALAVNPEDKDQIGIRCEVMLGILVDNDPKGLKNISKAAKIGKADRAESKKFGIIQRLTSRVNESDEEILKLYGDLITVCYEKGMTTNAQVDVFQETLNKFTTDATVKKEILKIAIAAGYKVCEWSIEQYTKLQKNNTGTRIGVAQKIATTVNTDIEF